MSIRDTVYEIISTCKLSLQDVIEINEMLIQTYDTQLRESLKTEQEEDEEHISVENDSDGDCVDKEGFIYDTTKRTRIGQKDRKTKVKTMYQVV
jgi:hypothetical protein